MFTQALTAWLATYFLHSALLLGAVWLIAKRTREKGAARSTSTERLWRAALIGALLTATVQTQLAPQLVWPAFSTQALPPGSVHGLGSVQPEPIEAVQSSSASAFGLLSVAGGSSSSLGQQIVAPALRHSNWIIAAWALVALTLFTRRALQRRRFVRSLGERRSLAEPERARVMSGLPVGIARDRDVRLTASAELASPVVLSQAEICLPERALRELSGRALASMLAHEYAHVARRDAQWLVLYQALEAVLFFQPLVFVATRALRADAELASDRKAVEGGADALALADSLATVAQWGAPPAGALGVLGERDSSLMTRVRALLDSEVSTRRTSRLATVLLGGMLLGLACAGPSVDAPGKAESASPDASDSPEPARAAPAEAHVLLCEFLSNDELIVGEQHYNLPGDWERFSSDLGRAAHPDQSDEIPAQLSTLKVAIRGHPDVAFANVLRVMMRCGAAQVQVWDLELLVTSGRTIPIPLPGGPGTVSLPEPEEIVEEEEGDEAAALDFSADPRRFKVRVSRVEGWPPRYRLGATSFSSLESMVEAMTVMSRTSTPISIQVETSGDPDFAEVCAMLDAIMAADLGDPPLLFVGQFD